MAEDPTKTEQPAGEVPVQDATPAAPTVDVDGMIAELEKAGVTDTQGISNKLEAAQQSGRLAQLLGDERQRSQSLEAQVADMQRQPPAQQPHDPFDAQPGQTIDLEAAIEKGVNSVLTKRDQAALQAQQQNLQKWNQIQQDKDFGLVQEVWEGQMKDPNFVLQIQSGQVDPYIAYTNVVRGYYKGIAQRSLATIKQLHGGAQTPIPHVETGERVPTNLVKEGGAVEPDSVKRTRELKDKVEKGHQLTDAEELDIIDSLLHAPVATPSAPRK